MSFIRSMSKKLYFPDERVLEEVLKGLIRLKESFEGVFKGLIKLKESFEGEFQMVDYTKSIQSIYLSLNIDS